MVIIMISPFGMFWKPTRKGPSSESIFERLYCRNSPSQLQRVRRSSFISGYRSSYCPLPALRRVPCMANSYQTASGYWSGGVMATMPEGAALLIGPTPIRDWSSSGVSSIRFLKAFSAAWIPAGRTSSRRHRRKTWLSSERCERRTFYAANDIPAWTTRPPLHRRRRPIHEDQIVGEAASGNSDPRPRRSSENAAIAARHGSKPCRPGRTGPRQGCSLARCRGWGGLGPLGSALLDGRDFQPGFPRLPNG